MEQLALFCLIGEECEAKHSQPLKREQGAAMRWINKPQKVGHPSACPRGTITSLIRQPLQKSGSSQGTIILMRIGVESCGHHKRCVWVGEGLGRKG